MKKLPPPKTPKALKPWDIPETPTSGDATAEEVFVAMGKALNCWNEFEQSLAGVFAFLISEDGSELARNAYGSIVTFRGRKEMIEATAKAFFFLHPDRDGILTKALKNFLDEAINFSARRNEIAHGIVEQNRAPPPSNWPLERYLREGFFDPNKIAPHVRRPIGYVLKPSEVSGRKNKFEPGKMDAFLIDYIPTYVYCAVQILVFADHFRSLRERASDLSLAILAHRVNSIR